MTTPMQVSEFLQIKTVRNRTIYRVEQGDQHVANVCTYNMTYTIECADLCDIIVNSLAEAKAVIKLAVDGSRSD